LTYLNAGKVTQQRYCQAFIMFEGTVLTCTGDI